MCQIILRYISSLLYWKLLKLCFLDDIWQFLQPIFTSFPSDPIKIFGEPDCQDHLENPRKPPGRAVEALDDNDRYIFPDAVPIPALVLLLPFLEQYAGQPFQK